MSKKWYRAVAGAVLLEFLFCQLGQKHVVWGDESLGSSSSQDFPEGSSSVIESLTWRVTASDPAALHKQAKTLIGQIAEAVLVKESESLLVISLPTGKLSTLRQELSELGSVSAQEAEAAPSAPTTLLRLMFVRP